MNESEPTTEYCLSCGEKNDRDDRAICSVCNPENCQGCGRFNDTDGEYCSECSAPGARLYAVPGTYPVRFGTGKHLEVK